MKEIKKLKALGACDEAIKWLREQDDFASAWKDCKHGNWMLWLLKKKLDLSDELQLRQLTLAKARCAKLVLHLMKDERSRKAVEVAENFGNGNATRDELDDADAAAADAAAAAAAADAAADAAAAYAAAAAAYAAAYAAAAAAYAADAAAAAAAADAAADAATAAAYAAATYAAKQNILAKCADEVRTIFPDAPIL